MDKIPACKLFLETVIDFLLSVEDLCLSLNKAIDDIVSHDVRCRHCYLTRQNVNQNIDNRHEPGCQCLSLLRELQYCSFEQLKQINQNMNILNLFSNVEIDRCKKEMTVLQGNESSDIQPALESPPQPPFPLPPLTSNNLPTFPTLSEIENNENRSYVLIELRSIVNYLNKFHLESYVTQRSALLDLKPFFIRLAYMQPEVSNALGFIESFATFDIIPKYEEFCRCLTSTPDLDIKNSFVSLPVIDCKVLYKHRTNILMYYVLPRPDFSCI